MPKIVWDNTGERLYETGVRNGVLYPIQPERHKLNGAYNHSCHFRHRYQLLFCNTYRKSYEAADRC